MWRCRGLSCGTNGGSVMDAAKAMRLFHESPHLSIRELSLPFLDARKRIAEFPQVEHKVRLVAVPTTSATPGTVLDVYWFKPFAE